MAKRTKLTDQQLEQRRKAAAAGAAKAHDSLCGCPQCYFRARKIALEGGAEDFPSRVDWAAAQELQRAAKAQAAEAIRAQAKGIVHEGDEDMPPKPGAIRVVQLEDRGRLFVAGGTGSTDTQDQTRAEARELLWARDPAAWIDD